MSIKLKEITKNSEVRAAKELYRSAFPKEERAPFFLLKKWAKKPSTKWLSIYDDDLWVGFFYLLTRGDLAYLMFFAIDETKRGCGYGSKALTALKERYPNHRIFLALEQLDETADNYEQRQARTNFYLKNGFTNRGHVISEGRLLFASLGWGEDVKLGEYETLVDDWSGKWWRKGFHMGLY